MAVEESRTLVRPVQTWREPHSHYLTAMRDRWYSLLVELYDGVSFATATFWRTKDIKGLMLPITTGSISSPMGLGSDSTPVRVEIAGIETYLADSQQFALEYGCRLWPNGCYYLMPSFRGELNDNRHLGQFFHSEAEIPGELNDVLALIEEYVRWLGRFFRDELSASIEEAAGTLEHLERLCDDRTEFPRLHFSDAARELADVEGTLNVSEDGAWRSLTSLGERTLIERYGDFTWVSHADELAVPFYQATTDGPDGLPVALTADWLFGIGETVGAGQRHATAAAVRAALAKHQVPETEYEWYIRMREEHPMQTSGFGLGVERFLLWLLRHDDIRDMQLLSRANGLSIVP